jgi:hypothetical protein
VPLSEAFSLLQRSKGNPRLKEKREKPGISMVVYNAFAWPIMTQIDGLLPLCNFEVRQILHELSCVIYYCRFQGSGYMITGKTPF